MRAAASRMAHLTTTNAVTGAAIRISHSLPAPVRKELRRVFEWSDRRVVPSLEDWSTPLISTGLSSRSSGDLLMVTNSASSEPDATEYGQPSNSAVSAGPDGPVLRCLVITGALDVSGVDEVAAFLARRLVAYGLQTSAIHARPDPSDSGQPRGRLGRMLQMQGIEVCEADQTGLRRWIDRWQPDVISAHHAPGWALDVALDLGIPYVDNLHGMHDLFGADWRAQAERGKKLSAIVAVSDLVRQQYLAGNPDFPSDRIVTIPNGVDSEHRTSGDRETVRSRLGLADEYLFVSLARHSLQKNSYGLVTAFGEIAKRYSNIHLVIAGRLDDERYGRQVLRLRESLSCRNRIHLRANTAAPAELLAAADGFVLNSFFEGWSLASMEALSAGSPVVLSDVGGAREQIGNDQARGYLVPNPLGDPLRVNWESMGAARYWRQANQDELVSAMERLIVNRDYYLQSREQLAAESAARFSAENCLIRHAAVLQAVAAGVGLSTEEAR